jgi:hypothetical protein
MLLDPTELDTTGSSPKHAVVPYNFLSFVVASGRIVVGEFSQYETRGENALKILEALVARYPALFEGRRGCVSYNDWPPDPSLLNDYELVFSNTKSIREPTIFLPFPCPYSLAWPQVGVADGESLMQELLASQFDPESDRAFWIGADTNPVRRSLAELGNTFPELFDIEIMDWKRDSAELELRSTSRYVPMRDLPKFKYLIDCPGGGYSGRLRWLLAAGRPLFIVDRDVIEPWHDFLVPWRDFVPVKRDLTDLLESHALLEREPALRDYLSRNAKAFARANLLKEPELDRMYARTSAKIAVA